MREFVKGVFVVLVLAGVVATPFAWAEDRADTTTWLFRFGAPVVVAFAFVAFWRMHVQKDEVPDYLSQLGLRFFDRGGFCFAIVPRVEEGTCFLDAYFQNKFDRPCRGRIALRPVRGLLGRGKLTDVYFDIDCPAAAFGRATISLPVPVAVQGKRQKFEVGASVEYPSGRGRMVRFREGAVLRTDSDFGDVFGTAIGVAGALVGTFVLSSPLTVKIRLPSNVADELTQGVPMASTTLWRLGDPPLDVVSLRQ